MTASAGGAAITTTRSPFALLRDADEAEEVLILTFVASLEFFERFALGEARGLQAATTVISDAAMVSADPVTVRGAGVRYIDARAVCPEQMAFHPKLIVIASQGRATIAVGSGNLTLAGWHGNEELWTVLHADQERGPTTIRDVAGFLRMLSDGRLRLSPEAPGILTRVAGLLDRLASQDPGPVLVSTLDQDPIIDRLPDGPVDELIIYSPYYDAGLAALSALCKKLRPEKLTVFVQEQTSVDGPALQVWLDEQQQAQLRWCSADRFRHGKLIEWTRDGVREALTGSPNLSAPAMQRTIAALPGQPGSETRAKSANCELGLIGRIPETLAPAGIAAPEAGVGALRFSRDPADTHRGAMVLLGATLVDGVEVRLLLAAELTASMRIQTHDAERDWTTASGFDELAPGKTEYAVPAIGLGAGTALRLHGAQGSSNEVFVVDPARARARPFKRTGPDSGAPSDLVRHGELAVLYEIAELMRPKLLELRVLVPKQKPATDSTGDGDQDDHDPTATPRSGQTLEEYLAACSAVLDEAVIRWALAIPSLPSLGGANRIDQQKGMLTTEVGDDAAEAGDDEDEEPEEMTFAGAVRLASAHRRRQWRSFCERALALAPGWPHLMRAYVARLTLNAVAADLWSDETAEGEILLGLVRVLVADGDDMTDEEQTALASYTAIALAILREAVWRMSVNDEATIRFKAAAKSALTLIQALDPRTIDEIIAEISEAFYDITTGEDVFEIACEAVAPQTGVIAAVALLEDEYDLAAVERNGALVFTDPITALPPRQLVLAAGLVGDDGPAVVHGTTSAGREMTCVWNKPLMMIATNTPKGWDGRVYRLQTGTSPRSISEGWTASNLGIQDNLPKPIENWMAGQAVPEHAKALIALAAAR